jgi:hypothetical protein
MIGGFRPVSEPHLALHLGVLQHNTVYLRNEDG